MSIETADNLDATSEAYDSTDTYLDENTGSSASPYEFYRTSTSVHGEQTDDTDAFSQSYGLQQDDGRTVYHDFTMDAGATMLDATDTITGLSSSYDRLASASHELSTSNDTAGSIDGYPTQLSGGAETLSHTLDMTFAVTIGDNPTEDAEAR